MSQFGGSADWELVAMLLGNDRELEFVDAAGRSEDFGVHSLSYVADEVAGAAKRTLLLLVCLERAARLRAAGIGAADAIGLACDDLVADSGSNQPTALEPNFAGEAYGTVLSMCTSTDVDEVVAALSGRGRKSRPPATGHAASSAQQR